MTAVCALSTCSLGFGIDDDDLMSSYVMPCQVKSWSNLCPAAACRGTAEAKVDLPPWFPFPKKDGRARSTGRGRGKVHSHVHTDSNLVHFYEPENTLQPLPYSHELDKPSVSLSLSRVESQVQSSYSRKNSKFSKKNEKSQLVRYLLTFVAADAFAPALQRNVSLPERHSSAAAASSRLARQCLEIANPQTRRIETAEGKPAGLASRFS